ncbi:hypothetical protein [Nocardia sp. NBC_01388]|uniref:hypothetical protein n=1 Tax=Nocardia sp. NBC_01388 TaxID=2903596 RepID=UPI003252D971
MTTLSHPAIALAVGAFSEDGRAARFVAAIDRDDTVVVLVASTSPFDSDSEVRGLMFVDHDGAQWRLPGVSVVSGSPCRHTTRAATTRAAWPLEDKRTRSYCRADGEICWFGLTGYAAEDAVAVTVVSSVSSDRVEVGADGLVLAAVRARPGETPVVIVHLATGENLVAP